MAENIRLITYSEQTVTPMNDAIIYDAGIGKNGIMNGVDVSASGNVISLTGGYGVICGRLFQVQASEIPITLSSGADLSGRLYIRLDLSNTSEPITIQTEVASTLSTLEQEYDANFTNGVYEMELARFTVTSAEIANINRTVQEVHGGVKIIEETDTSLDDYTDQGIYYFDHLHPPVDYPSTLVNGWVIVLRGGAAMKQILLRQGSENTQADTFVRTFTNGAWTSWRRLVSENEMYYMPGNRVDAYFYTAGTLTTGNTGIVFDINLPKPLHSSVRSISYVGTNETIQIRQNNKYLANDVRVKTLNPSITIRPNTIYCWLTKSAGFGGINNDTVAIIGHMLLQFN